MSHRRPVSGRSRRKTGSFSSLASSLRLVSVSLPVTTPATIGLSLLLFSTRTCKAYLGLRGPRRVANMRRWRLETEGVLPDARAGRAHAVSRRRRGRRSATATATRSQLGKVCRHKVESGLARVNKPRVPDHRRLQSPGLSMPDPSPHQGPVRPPAMIHHSPELVGPSSSDKPSR